MSFADCSHISGGIVSITQYCVNFVSCEESLVVTTSLRNATNIYTMLLELSTFYLENNSISFHNGQFYQYLLQI